MIPEEIGPFRLFPPQPEAEKTEWSMSDGGGWLPVLLEDRDAGLLIAGFLLAGGPFAYLEELRDRYNHADPSAAVTSKHIIKHLREKEPK